MMQQQATQGLFLSPDEMRNQLKFHTIPLNYITKKKKNPMMKKNKNYYSWPYLSWHTSRKFQEA